MSAWKTAVLSDIAEINPRDTKPYSGTPVSFIGMSALNAITATTSLGEDREYGPDSKGYTQFRNGDILVAKITPCWENGKIGIARLARETGIGSTEFHVVRAGSQLDSQFALHLLRTPNLRRNGEMRMTGSGGQRRVPTSYLSKLEIPLPPIEDQRRIAAILDEADAIRVKRRAQLAHLDELPQAIFHEMFGRYTASGMFGDIATIQAGIQVSPNRKNLTRQVSYLRVANVYRGRLSLETIKTIGVTDIEQARTTLLVDDLLFVEGHANPKEVGRVARWDDSIQGCVHQNHLIRGRVDQQKASARFVEAWMNSQEGQRYFRRAGKTTSGLNTISARTVRSAPLPLPPLREQRDYSTKVANIDAERVRVSRALDVDNDLFSALQHRAFRCEL